MKMRTDLHWPVTLIGHHDSGRLAALIQSEFALFEYIFAGYHRELLVIH